MTSKKIIITLGAGFIFAIVPSLAPAQIVVLDVSSDTHPDQNLWYPKFDIELSWSRPDDAYGFSFELNHIPRTVPDDVLDTTKTTTKAYKGLEDGTWFFHIKARSEAASADFGPTRNFRILVDATMPKAFVISLVNEANPNNLSDHPMISFQTLDLASGINRYSVYLDNQLVEKNAKSPYSFNKIGTGPHLIKVVAVDLAGNEQAASLPVIVSGPTTPGLFQKSIGIPVYLFIILILLVWGLIIANFKLLFGYTRRPKRSYGFGSIAHLQSEIDLTLETMRSEIDEQLLNLHATSSKELISKQAEVAKAITADIAKTKRKIDNKINPRPKKKPAIKKA